MEHDREVLDGILGELTNPSWPAVEVALGHGNWWNNDPKVFVEQAILAVLYTTVPLSYSEFRRIRYDAKLLAAALNRGPPIILDDADMRSVCSRLQDQISTTSLARDGGRYVYETLGLGRRSLVTDEFTGLFSPMSVQFKGVSETQVPVESVLPETYNGYSFQALGTYECDLLRRVTNRPNDLDKEVWCLTKPNAINMTLGCRVEGERVRLPPQLPSWNSVNAMYPFLGVAVAGDTGVVAQASIKGFVNMEEKTGPYFKPGEGIYCTKPNSKAPVPIILFGNRVMCLALEEGYETTDFDAKVVDLTSAGVFSKVREIALLWQKVYQFELGVWSGGCIARRCGDPRSSAPSMIPLSAISKETLPNMFCEETLHLATELARAKEDNYYFDFSSWPFLFLSPHNLQTMLVAAVLHKHGIGHIHSDKEGDNCAVIKRSLTEKADVRGKAKALVDCLSILYTRIDEKIREESRSGRDSVVEYYGDTPMWAVLNALTSLELVYLKEPGHAFLKNSVIISNAVQKASSCIALLENLKQDIDSNTLDIGIMKFLAHAAVHIGVIKCQMLHTIRDVENKVLAVNVIDFSVHSSQVNIRWANRDRIESRRNLVSNAVEQKVATSNYRYQAILKSGVAGTWQEPTGKKIVAKVEVSIWNIETLTLLYNDIIRVVKLGDVVEVLGVGQKSLKVEREKFVKWSEKQMMVKEFFEEVEAMDGVPGPTKGIWEVVLRWQKDIMQLNDVKKNALHELLANAIVLSAVATGRLVETPPLTSQISLARKYLTGKSFLLWNGNAHREVQEIPRSIDIPSDLVVNNGEHPGLRMAKCDFAKQLVKSEHGAVVGKVVDIGESPSSLALRSPPGLSHIYTYIIGSSPLKQYTMHETSRVIGVIFAAASKKLPRYRINDVRLGLLVDAVKIYESQNALVVLSHVDDSGNLKVRISGKRTSIETTGTQVGLTAGAPSLLGASGNRLEQHTEQMEANIDQELKVSSLRALQNALRNRAKSKKTKRGLGAVASAIIAQQIAVDQTVRYRKSSYGGWGIVRRLPPESEGLREQVRNKGQVIEIDGPLAAKGGTAFLIAHDCKTDSMLLKIMIDRGQCFVFRGLTLIENGDGADVIRMGIRADGDAWIESFSSGSRTGEEWCYLPYDIEIG